MNSENWNGFTDADIAKIKATQIETSDENIPTVGPFQIQNLNGGTANEKLFSKDETSDSDYEIHQLSHKFRKGSKSKESMYSEFMENNPDFEWSQTALDLSDDSCRSSDTSKKEDLEVEKSVKFGSTANIQDLEEFELRQKRIEADNARRRALINKAITDKRTQTEAETLKLAHISSELKRLDSILSADVSILRDYIEKASLDFTEAEKRYLKAEKEFIEAKLLFFEKMQRKEQLTEHLCTIIEQNENRKADKLVELMKKLEMEAVLEDYQVTHAEPILSKFCTLNDEAYHCYQTLRPTSQSPGSTTSQDGETSQCNGMIDHHNEQAS